MALVSGGAVLAQADDRSARTAQTQGGLVVSPAKIERVATPGAANAVTISNNSRESLAVEVAVRPWRQSSSGLVSPNRRSTLRAVTLSEDAFTLAPGASRAVAVTLQAAPAGGSLYGALEIVALPRDSERRNGVIAGYRLVSALRYNAVVPVYSLRAGATRLVGRGSKRIVAMTLRNTGNTVEPVTGTVRVRGPLGTRQGSIQATRILPGKSVRVPMVSARGLQPGRYTATVTLRQGRERFNVTKRIRVRR